MIPAQPAATQTHTARGAIGDVQLRYENDMSQTQKITESENVFTNKIFQIFSN